MFRKDQHVLLHIGGRDCVAIEAKYHKHCYQAYTRCLSKKTKLVGPTLYDRAFDEFCLNVIEKRIIQNGDILLLSYLLKEFIKCVLTLEKINVSYRAEKLKKRLQNRYPQLVFHPSKSMNKGTLVYSDILTVGDVADCIVVPEREFDTQSDSEEEEYADQNTERDKEVKARDIYFIALEIRKLLRDSQGINAGWPPDSHDLTLTRAKESIPVKLYNFLAWSVGFTCDPTMDKNVEISSKEDARVVSIAQDLIYAESKGKKQTHKSLALGMAVRQMTGSVRLLKILHGLGHTASADTVSKHDTALAIISSNGDGKELKIPRNISKNIFTTLVWDNNDFNEETFSGKGTTHVANGIIVQNENTGLNELAEKETVSKKTRTIKAPETNIIPLTSKEKGILSLHNESFELSIKEESHRGQQTLARNADFLYLSQRKRASEDGEYLPGWTGFNTNIYKEVRPTATIGYLPVIDAPVTDMSTVNALLKHSVSICNHLNLPEIVLVFDEAIYAKAQMIRWANEEFKKRLVIRLGDFHTVMSFCSAIGKIFKDAGLQVSILKKMLNNGVFYLLYRLNR